MYSLLPTRNILLLFVDASCNKFSFFNFLRAVTEMEPDDFLFSVRVSRDSRCRPFDHSLVLGRLPGSPLSLLKLPSLLPLRRRRGATRTRGSTSRCGYRERCLHLRQRRSYLVSTSLFSSIILLFRPFYRISGGELF